MSRLSSGVTIAIRALHEIDDWTSAIQVGDRAGGHWALGADMVASRVLNYAVTLGLVEKRRVDGCAGRRNEYRLTQRGIDLFEGRLRRIETRPGGARFVASWLMSLPRDIRIEAGK